MLYEVIYWTPFVLPLVLCLVFFGARGDWKGFLKVAPVFVLYFIPVYFQRAEGIQLLERWFG